MKKFLFVIMMIATASLAVVVGGLYSCERNEPEGVSGNMEYLKLSTNDEIGDLSRLSLTDKLVLKDAGERLQMKSVCGMLYLTYASAEEANVAENIYNYYLRMVDRSNKVLGVRKSRTKIARVGEFDTQSNQCVSALMGYYNKRFYGDTVKYNQKTYQTWIEDNGFYHADHVDVKDYGDIMETFFNIEEVPEDQWPSEGYHTDIVGSYGECYSVVINQGVETGHVAMVVDGMWGKIDGEYPAMKCYNPQDRDDKGNEGCIIVDRRTISKVYKITGIKR